MVGNRSNSSKGEGNTQSSPSLWWVFTLNNYSLEDIKKIQELECSYVFQEEIAPTTGTPHLQGTLKWNRKQKFTACRQLYKMDHWEKYKDPKESIKYCSDPAKRAPNGKVFSKGIRIPRPWRGLKLCFQNQFIVRAGFHRS